MTRHRHSFCILTLAVFVTTGTSLAPAQSTPIGLLSKVINDVTRKAPQTEWTRAAKGDMVGTGHQVRTGDRSFAILKFSDNTMVRIREASELTVTGAVDGEKFSKSVDLNSGAVGFKVQRQRVGEEFRFTSPTSVASVRGTDGLFSATTSGDTLIISSGTVSLLNRITQNTVDVPEGFTGVSTPDGSIISRTSTREERRSAAEAVRTGDQPRQLKLQLRTPDGEKRDLIIDYKE
jgi:hypothetical protein